MIIFNNIKIFKDYIGETILNPLISYPDMKTKYPIELIDLRRQADHITPKSFNSFKNTALILITLDCL